MLAHNAFVVVVAMHEMAGLGIAIDGCLNNGSIVSLKKRSCKWVDSYMVDASRGGPVYVSEKKGLNTVMEPLCLKVVLPFRRAVPLIGSGAPDYARLPVQP